MKSDPPKASRASNPFVLATFFDGGPAAGGAYVHRLGILKVLRCLENSSDVKVIVICDSKEALHTVRSVGLDAILQERGLITRILGLFSSVQVIKSMFGRSWASRISPIDRLLTRLETDLVFFTGQDNRARQLYTHNYMFTVYDLCHLEHPEFPEVAHHGEFERRERLFQNVLRKAVAIIVDSEAGGELVRRHYGIPSSRIYAAPFLVSAEIRNFVADPVTAAAIREQHGISQPYIFYPAQFWQHKNHRYIIDALAVMLKRFGWAPQAVFCGSDKGNLKRVLDYASTLEVRPLVKYCGFIPNEQLPYLYRGALALVMPTYFGPSNIPPVEASALGTPVCYSDLPSFRAQLGESAHYVDLTRPESLAAVLQSIHDGTACASGLDSSYWLERLDDQENQYVELLKGIIKTYRYKIPFVRGERSW